MLPSLRSLAQKSRLGGLWKCSLSPSYHKAMPIVRCGLFSNKNTNGNGMKFMDDSEIAFLAKDKSKWNDLKEMIATKYGLDAANTLSAAIEVTERYSGSKIYSEYDAAKMSEFFSLWTTPLTSPCHEPPIVTSAMDKDAFLAEIMNDKSLQCIINGIKSRELYASYLYGSCHTFGKNTRESQVMGKMHVGQPGVGKTSVLKAVLPKLSVAYPGLATAFIELKEFGKAPFSRPPEPDEVLKCAQQRDPTTRKAFVIYDDFEECYENEYGPHLTACAYSSANHNTDTMVHVLGSSQWLRKLVHRRLPLSGSMTTIFASDPDRRFKYYGSCTSINSGRMGPCPGVCEPIMDPDEYKILLMDICAKTGYKMKENDDLSSWFQWICSGNARYTEDIVNAWADCKGEVDEFENAIHEQIIKQFDDITDDGKKLYWDILEQIIKQNPRFQYVAPPGMEPDYLLQFILERDPFAIKPVDRWILNFDDEGEQQIGWTHHLIDCGLLAKDSKSNIYPGRLIFLPICAIRGTAELRTETTTIIKDFAKEAAKIIAPSLIPLVI